MLNRNILLGMVVTIALGTATDAAVAGRRAARLLEGAAAAPPVANVGFKNGDCCLPAPAPVCKVYQPCVKYKHRGRCCDPCAPMAKQVLLVKSPCDCCCMAEVPVCLPACCQDACISSKCGLLGCGTVTYDYDCGVSVTMKFRRGGDVVVVYRGC